MPGEMTARSATHATRETHAGVRENQAAKWLGHNGCSVETGRRGRWHRSCWEENRRKVVDTLSRDFRVPRNVTQN